jgi:arylsulfatase A-like enzyme
VGRQIAWLGDRLNQPDEPVFAFLNVGETHAPYYHEGASWDPRDNPCIPFAATNDAEKCRHRQKACVEFVDREIAPLLEAFAAGTTIICGDHGDAWGEDGLWEHGIYHPKVLEVPLLFRLPGR